MKKVWANWSGQILWELTSEEADVMDKLKWYDLKDVFLNGEKAKPHRLKELAE